MKTLLVLLVALMAALVFYTLTQDLRAVKIDELRPPNPKKAVPPRATIKALIWQDYIPNDVFDRLRIEQGITVDVTTFQSNEEFDRILASGQKFDVALAADYVARRLDRQEVSVDIDYAHIPNHKNIAPGMRRAEEMGKLLRCSVPFIFGTVALGYNASHVERLPLKWSALFDPSTPELLRGRTAIIDDPRHSLGIALLALGKSPNSRDYADICAAGDLIIGSMRHLTRLGNYDLSEKLENESVYLSMAWGGDIAFAMEQNKNLRFVSPDEGAMLFFECFVIFRESQKRGFVEEFIDYMLRPEISARVTNYSYYATVNAAAMPHVDRTLLNGPAYYLPRGQHLNFRDDLDEAEKYYEEVWRIVRSYYLTNVKPTLDAELNLGGKFIDGNDTRHAPPPDPKKHAPSLHQLGAAAPMPGR